MCRRSRTSAFCAGACLKEAVESVNPGRMPITPLHSDAIRTNESDRERPDIRGYGRWVQESAATDLFHAPRTRTCQT
jgi:hypothetical protein